MLSLEELTDQEIDEEELVRKFVPRLKKLILNNLGTRQINSKELNELSTYWACSFIEYISSKIKQKPEFLSLSDNEKFNFLIHHDADWSRGIECYGKMAGEPLIPIIEKAIKEKGHVELLDIGCGKHFFHSELLSKYYGKIKCIGISNQIPTTKFSDIEHKLTIAEVLPEEWTNKFDLVTCFESSMYFYDNLRAFGEALRVTKPRGYLFYGHGSLKSIGNENLFEKLLDLKNYEYIVPDGFSRQGQSYEGSFGRWTSRNFPFWGLTNELKKKGKFTAYDKNFSFEERHVNAWCGTTIKVQGI